LRDAAHPHAALLARCWSDDVAKFAGQKHTALDSHMAVHSDKHADSRMFFLDPPKIRLASAFLI
jgi:hypothetical protein